MLGVIMLNVKFYSLLCLMSRFIYCYAECHVSFIVMLSVVMLSVIMLIVVMLSVVAPEKHIHIVTETSVSI